MRRFGFGAAAGLAAALLAAGAFATPAAAQNAQKAPPKDTTAVKADTGFQSAGMQEFERRRKRGGGYYLTGRQLLAQDNQSLADIIAMKFPGLRVVYGQHLSSQYLVSTRGEGPNALIANGGTSLCYVQAFVDGSFVEDGDISWVRPTDVAGVEYYDGTRTPPAYRRPDGQCGVVLIWMKSG